MLKLVNLNVFQSRAHNAPLPLRRTFLHTLRSVLMPPKKKDAAEPAEANAEPNIEAYELPRALVTRIAKSEVCISRTAAYAPIDRRRRL